MMFSVKLRFARMGAVVAAIAGVSGMLTACTAGGPGSSQGSASSSPAAVGTTSPAAQATPAATGVPSSPTVSASASASASASGQLAAYFAAASNADSHLKQAGALVNGLIGASTIQFRADELAAIEALSGYTTAAGKAIPAGLPPELLQRVMLSYSDIESRTAAFRFLPNYVGSGSVPVASQTGQAILQELKHGAPAAARFASDLAAARDLASTTSPVVPQAASSHATADVAIRVAFINSANTGCDSSGGQLATSLPPVTWKSGTFAGTSDHTDGSIGSTPFTATYRAGRGWNVMIWTC